jgi:hypothetical protein
MRRDLVQMETHKKEFTPMAELKVVKALLQTLESKLSSFTQLSPKLDPRRA